MANVVFTNATAILGASGLNWIDGGQTFRCLLCEPAYAPDQDADLYVADISNELAGGGYARQTLAGRTATVDNANNRTDYGATNAAFAGLASAQTVGWVLVYRFITNDADSPLICALDIADVSLSGLADFTVRWNGGAANGTIFRVTAV